MSDLDPTDTSAAALPLRPHQIYSAWLGRLPFWHAVSNAWPLGLLSASEDEKDAWVLERWKEQYVADAAPKPVVLPDGCVDGHSPDRFDCELGNPW
jgi:hypothetical protein